LRAEIETLVTRLDEVGEYFGFEAEGFVDLGAVEKLERILGTFLAREEELEKQYQREELEEDKRESKEREEDDREAIEEMNKKNNELEVNTFFWFCLLILNRKWLIRLKQSSMRRLQIIRN